MRGSWHPALTVDRDAAKRPKKPRPPLPQQGSIRPQMATVRRLRNPVQKEVCARLLTPVLSVISRETSLSISQGYSGILVICLKKERVRHLHMHQEETTSQWDAEQGPLQIPTVREGGKAQIHTVCVCTCKDTHLWEETQETGNGSCL